MTLKKYETKLKKVIANWDKMTPFTRDWAREILKSDLKEIK